MPDVFTLEWIAWNCFTDVVQGIKLWDNRKNVKYEFRLNLLDFKCTPTELVFEYMSASTICVFAPNIICLTQTWYVWNKYNMFVPNKINIKSKYSKKGESWNMF